jgi:hypothetical protein
MPRKVWLGLLCWFAGIVITAWTLWSFPYWGQHHWLRRIFTVILGGLMTVFAVVQYHGEPLRTLEEQQEDVYHNLKFGVDLRPGEHPSYSEFSVTNWGRTNIGKHEIACEINLMVLERNTVQNSEGERSSSDAPLTAAGGTQSDQCLSTIGFPPESTPICYDITVNFSYSLETQPSVSKAKSTRFWGFMRGGSFGWSEQPTGQKGSYCTEARKQRDFQRSKASEGAERPGSTEPKRGS